jgi:hypothetical protein
MATNPARACASRGAGPGPYEVLEERSHIWDVRPLRREHRRVVTSEHMDTSRYGSDPGGLWAAAEDDGNPSKNLADQQAWARAVLADFPPDGEVMCDPRTFMPLDELVDVSVGVMGFAPELATKALARAAARMSMVATDGKEYETFEALEELELIDEDAAYTPNYISAPERRGDIVGLANIDTKGERYTWMFRTFLRIIAEELRAEGAVPAKLIPFTSSPDDYPTDDELYA